MNSPIAYSVDDKDLDDAALWAVIDSAALASLSSATTTHKPRTKPLTPIPFPLTSPQPHSGNHTRNNRHNYNNNSDGEVVQNHRPHRNLGPTKKPRVSMSSPQQMMTVKHVHFTPTSPPPTSADSPEMKNFALSNYHSPNASAAGYEKMEMRHSLAGQFPTVSLFKEYQNAAMAVSY